MKHTPRKRFGQNFLQDESVIDQIIDVIGVNKSDRIVEIGPGQGALTFPLLETGCQLHVVEFDRDLAQWWQRQQQRYPDLTVHQADALKFDFSTIAQDQPLRLVGNLPYNISTPLLFHFDSQRQYFRDLHVMLQKEVADRLCAAPGSKIYGRLTVMLAAHFNAEPLLDIPPDAFKPAPKVTSTFLQMTPQERTDMAIKDAQIYATVVRQAFSQRRKTLRKSLKSMLSEADFEQCEINSGLRPEALAPVEFSVLANYLADKSAPIE